MPETVRIVSDGEERVLYHGEVFRIAPMADARAGAVERRAGSTAMTPISVRYVGFQDVNGRREYALDAQRGDHKRRYTLSIELTAFSKHHALMQDGPDICYQKLLHELADSELQGPEGIDLTVADLAAYREAHIRPPRRGSPPRTPGPGTVQATAYPRRDGGSS